MRSKSGWMADLRLPGVAWQQAYVVGRPRAHFQAEPLYGQLRHVQAQQQTCTQASLAGACLRIAHMHSQGLVLVLGLVTSVAHAADTKKDRLAHTPLRWVAQPTDCWKIAQCTDCWGDSLAHTLLGSPLST